MAHARFEHHQSSSARGGAKKSEAEALGRSRGGFSTKVHVVCDALGNPLAFCLTPGQRHDVTQAEALLEEALPADEELTDQERHELRAVLADRGYDSNAFVDCVERLGAEAVIPSKKNRREQRHIDRELYKDRNKVERFFGRPRALSASGYALREDGAELCRVSTPGVYHDVGVEDVKRRNHLSSRPSCF